MYTLIKMVSHTLGEMEQERIAYISFLHAIQNVAEFKTCAFSGIFHLLFLGHSLLTLQVRENYCIAV